MQVIRQKDDSFLIRATREEALGLANLLGALTDTQASKLHVPDAFYRLADAIEEPVSPDLNDANGGSLPNPWNRVSVSTQLFDRQHPRVDRVDLKAYDGRGALVAAL